MKIVSIFLALALTAVAAETPPKMSRVTSVNVPADSAAEYYAVQRDTAEVYKANKAPFPRLCWTSLTGEPTFVSMFPLSGIDKLNDPTWLSQQGDERSRQDRFSRLRNTNSHSTSKIVTDEDDAGWNPTPNGAPAAFASVSHYSVKSGKTADFLALIKEATATHKKIGKAKSVWVGRVSYGGDINEFYVVVGYASLADLSSGVAFRTAMGETAYNAFFKKMGETINSRQRNILRFRPEFSYVPAK